VARHAAGPDTGWSGLVRGSAATVTLEMTAQLLVGEGQDLPVRAVFRYDLADPYAVRATFSARATEAVSWLFGRDLLTCGVLGTAGDGDVQIWSCPDREAGVFIALMSPDGEAVLQVPHLPLEAFLRRTYDHCPPGNERTHLDIEKTISKLLAC
jgi:hypothetical protein